MGTMLELEKEILALSSDEREQLATIAWESLVSEPNATANPAIDPEGIQQAAQRNADIESDKVKPIDHAEFLRRTGGVNE